MKPIIPSLGLKQIRDTALTEFAQEKISKLTGNPNYPAPGAFPELNAVEVALSNYIPALVKADDGTKTDTIDKNTKRTILEDALTVLAMRCSLIANGDMVVFSSSGFEARKEAEATPVPLPAPANFKLAEGGSEGELMASFKRVDENHGYELWLSLTPVLNAATVKLTGSKTKIMITGLQSGKKYYGWARAIGANNTHGNWSDVSSHIPQ